MICAIQQTRIIASKMAVLFCAHVMSGVTTRTIIEWASAPERCSISPRLDKFESADMATTHFDQLIIRLGYPYLYCHQGNCEHLIMFTDVA